MSKYLKQRAPKVVAAGCILALSITLVAVGYADNATGGPTCGGVLATGFTTTADTGTKDVVVFGVANATSVIFPTWSDVGGQDDIVWYPGVHVDGGDWKATIDLSQHTGLGKIFVDVYMSNPTSTNVHCGSAFLTRTASSGGGSPSGSPNVQVSLYEKEDRLQSCYNMPISGSPTLQFIMEINNLGPGRVKTVKYAAHDNTAGCAPTTDNSNLDNNLLQMSGRTDYPAGSSGAAFFDYNTAQKNCGRVQVDATYQTDAGVDKVPNPLGVVINYGVNCGVPTTNNAVCVSIQAPSSVQPGQVFSATVVMRNNGTSTWTSAASYKLGSQNPTDNQVWRDPRVALPNSVAPRSSVTFSFSNTAPSTPGTYSFSWKMVQETVEWFGETCSASINVIAPTPDPICTAVTPVNFTTTATTGTQKVTATGVANATSVVFPTWSEVNGQDDIVWYPGTNLGNGNWEATVDLSRHPGLGKIFVDVYMSNAVKTNVFCKGIAFVRTAPAAAGPLDITKNVRNITQYQRSFANSISANPGDQVEFQMQVTANNGAVNSVTFSDSLPAKLNYVNNSLTIDGSPSGNTLNNLSLGNFTSGQRKTVSLRATVADTSQFSAGTTGLTNTASVTVGSNSKTAQAIVNVTISGTANLTCSPTTQTILVNQTVSFTASGGSGSLSWSASNSTNTGGTGSSFSTSYSNAGNYAVTVSSAGSSTNCNVIVNTPGSASLTLTKLARNITAGQGSFSKSISANPGDSVQFQLQVTASGNTPAQNVTVIDTLPSNFNLTSGSTTTNFGFINSGSTQTVTLTTSLAGDSSFSCGTTNTTNSAQATASNASSFSDSANIAVTRTNNCFQISSQQSNLSLTKEVRNLNSGSGFNTSINAANGDQVQFRLIIRNTSSATANNVRLTDNLPAGLNYIAGTFQADNGTSFGNLFGGNQFLGNLFSGQTRTLTFNATVNSSSNQTLTNAATVSADNTNSTNANASVFIGSVQGSNIDLLLSKRAFNQTQNQNATAVTAKSNDLIVYTLSVQNRGNAVATNYVFQDDLSDVLQLGMLEDFGGSSFDLAKLTLIWPAINIPANSTIEKTFSVRVRATFPQNSDNVMTNVFGNTVNVFVNKPTVAGIFIAPKTGSTTTLSLVFAILTVAGFITYRKKEQLKCLIEKQS